MLPLPFVPSPEPPPKGGSGDGWSGTPNSARMRWVITSHGSPSAWAMTGMLFPRRGPGGLTAMCADEPWLSLDVFSKIPPE